MRNKIEIQFKDGGTRPKSTKWGDLLHNKRVKLEKSGTQEWVFQSLMLLLEKKLRQNYYYKDL